MAIVKLKKITLCGLLEEKSRILEQLQRLGGAHLIPLTALPVSAAEASQQITETATDALKYLLQCRNKRHQLHTSENFDLQEVVDRTLMVKAECRRLSDQRDFLQKRIGEIEPWGDFRLTNQEDLGRIRLWFYIVPKRLMSKLDPNLVYQIVHQDNIRCYVVVLAEQEPESAAMPVPRTHTGKIPLSQLKNQLAYTQLQLEDIQAERESLTRWITLISLSLVENQDQADLKVAHAMVMDSKPFFVVQAWIAAGQQQRFVHFAQTQRIALQIAEPGPDDRPPTLLDNREPLAGGEDVIGFYQTPAYHDWDPSIVVFFSFALFFAMILSDAGYAAVFALFLAVKWRKWGSGRKSRRLRMLAAVTVLFSLLWGMLTGSYFGQAPAAGGILAGFKLLDLNDFDSMMRLSIAVGAVHIAFANLFKALRKKILAPVGWIFAVVGGLLYWLSISLADTNLQLAAYALLTPAVPLLLLFNGRRSIRRPADLLWRMFDGLKSLTGVTKLFGDVLSYMRLFALGLASASLALTFNQLAIQVYHSVPGVGLLFSLLILLLGHGLNLVLCLMSGVVHGLRLNFIEFYNWGVSDEGYPFKSFSRKGD